MSAAIRLGMGPSDGSSRNSGAASAAAVCAFVSVAFWAYAAVYSTGCRVFVHA